MNKFFLISLTRRTFIVFFGFKDFLKKGVCCRYSVGMFNLKYNYCRDFGCLERHRSKRRPSSRSEHGLKMGAEISKVVGQIK